MLMAKNRRKQPPNFVDLRPGSTKTPPTQIFRRPFIKSSSRYARSFILTAVLLAALLIIVFARRGSGFTPPEDIQHISQVSFTVYYPNPAKAPASFQCEPASARADNNVVFYRFTDGERAVSFSEVQTPGENIGLDSLFGFDAFATPNGTAYVGQQKSGPTAILNTKETLVTITGDKDVPDDVVNSFIKTLLKLK